MFWRDLTQAFRSFRTEPALTFVAVLSLAIGLGTTGGAASLLDASGFRPPAARSGRAWQPRRVSRRPSDRRREGWWGL